MFCPKCGTFSENDNNWCVKCGYNFSEIPEELRGGAQGESENAAEVKRSGEQSSWQAPSGAAGGFSAVSPAAKAKPKTVKDYFVWAILSAVFLNVAFGAAAIIFSGLTQAEKACQNLKKAQVYSEKTKLFCIIALCIGVAKYVFVGLFLMLVFIGGRYMPYLFY